MTGGTNPAARTLSYLDGYCLLTMSGSRCAVFLFIMGTGRDGSTTSFVLHVFLCFSGEMGTSFAMVGAKLNNDIFPSHVFYPYQSVILHPLHYCSLS